MGDQLSLVGTAPIAPPMAKAKTFLRWAGGKAWLIPIVAPGIHRFLATSGGRYHEPFLGGGALALHLGLPRMALADALPGLVELYKAVRANPAAVLKSVNLLIAQYGMQEEGYLAVRARRPTAPHQVAARFLYLNRLCFNGLHRENSKGEFNVPFGGPEKKSFPVTLETLQAAATALDTASIRCVGFRDAIRAATRGDVVYADPPYDDGFVDYTKDGFDAAAQAELALELKRASDRMVTVVTTNSDTPLIRELYAWAQAIPTAEARAINSDIEGRGRSGCLLITNEQKILGA